MIDENESRDSRTEMLRSPKKRVPVRVDLTDGSTLSGALYATMHTIEGEPGDVLDRLQHPLESYLPLALDDRHVLLRKSNIVSVEIAGEAARGAFAVEGACRFDVEVGLIHGGKVRGSIWAILPRPRVRAVDYLNSSAQRFLQLHRGDRVLLINRECVVHVSEVLEG